MAPEYIPYTYLVGWKKYNKWYYGVRYAKNCNPKDLWESYFTSSKIVHNLRETIGEPDVIQIRKTFDEPKKAIEWEFKVIKKIKNKAKWINIANGKPSFDGRSHSEQTIEKLKKPKPNGFGDKIRKIHKGKKRTEETRVKISASKKGLTLRAKNWNFEYNGQIIEIHNLANFCRNNNLTVSCMRDVYYGNQTQHKNYKKVKING